MRRVFLLLSAVLFCSSTASFAQCPTQPPIQNFTGTGSVVCPCFVPTEEAGAVLTPPAGDFPIQILSVSIGWGSQVGGAPQVLEQAIHIYEGGLPDPGIPVFTLPGPQMTDGAINQFDLTAFNIIVNSAPFTVTLEFMNQNMLDPFAPSVVHDGNGCQIGKNVVYASPGGWNDACLLGVTGDWVFTVTYRSVNCSASPGSVPDGNGVAGTPLTVSDAGGGQISLSWGGSCTSSDDDYEVYEGTIGNYYDHAAKLCTTSGATTVTLTPATTSTYYLVVPRNDDFEGSYGTDSSSLERPQGSSACLPKQTGTCS